jgi:hypothetical protein
VHKLLPWDTATAAEKETDDLSVQNCLGAKGQQLPRAWAFFLIFYGMNVLAKRGAGIMYIERERSFRYNSIYPHSAAVER